LSYLIHRTKSLLTYLPT